LGNLVALVAVPLVVLGVVVVHAASIPIAPIAKDTDSHLRKATFHPGG
jgi:hypothetical protein